MFLTGETSMDPSAEVVVAKLDKLDKLDKLARGNRDLRRRSFAPSAKQAQ